MREILFRGKAEAGEWIEGYLFVQAKGTPYEETYILGDLDHRDSIYDIWKTAEKVIPGTVGQWTGKYDKNGERIFEGDLVQAEMDFGPAGFYKVKGVSIGWHEDDGYSWEYFDTSTIEVVGNVHDDHGLPKGD